MKSIGVIGNGFVGSAIAEGFKHYTDVKIYDKDNKYLKNLKYLIIDCLWYNFHPSHFNLSEALELINLVRPKKTILTNLHTDLDYNDLKKMLPKNVYPAFDGMVFNF